MAKRWSLTRRATSNNARSEPLVNLESDEITGFEALLRWQHPERGLVPPADFIPVWEEIASIVPSGSGSFRKHIARNCAN